MGYYLAVAPALLPQVVGHPVTLHRFPEGVDGPHFYQTRAPAHPPWVRTARFAPPRTGKEFDVVVLDDRAGLVWAAQIAAVELHPYLGTVEALDRPTVVVFDLDPGAPAALPDAARVARWVRAELGRRGLESWVKTSGGKGLHVMVPTGGTTPYDAAKALAREVTERLRTEHPDVVVDRMARGHRVGKVLIDWSQNDPGKSTVAPYSLRGGIRPTVSTPVTWEEVAVAAETGDSDRLRFTPAEVLTRLDDLGDLFAPVAATHQVIP